MPSAAPLRSSTIRFDETLYRQMAEKATVREKISHKFDVKPPLSSRKKDGRVVERDVEKCVESV